MGKSEERSGRPPSERKGRGGEVGRQIDHSGNGAKGGTNCGIKRGGVVFFAGPTREGRQKCE